jgi:deoxycytidylate deaminase
MEDCNISKKDLKFIDKAKYISKKSNMLMKHGCIVVKNNKIISTGYNNYRNRFKDNFIKESCSCHAEMHALRLAFKNNSLSKTKKRVVQRQIKGI